MAEESSKTISPTLRLNKPAFLTLERPDGGKSVKIDVYQARRVLVDAEKQPTEEARWAKVLSYLAETLEIQAVDLAENMAMQFNNAIMEMVGKLNADLQKDFFSSVSSEDSTQASQETTPIGL